MATRPGMSRPPARFQEISHGSLEWNAVLKHRDRILRQPLGLTLSAEDVANEEQQRHFILSNEQMIVAGLICLPPIDGTIKIRQMWVHEDFEGSGLGQHLLNEVAGVFTTEGVRSLALHARKTACGFYEKCGYQTTGEAFMEIGIPHYLMIRQLA